MSADRKVKLPSQIAKELKMCFNELIRGLAERMGIAGEIEVDSEQRCLLEFDGMGVVIQGVGAAETVALLSPVGMPPPENPVQLYRALLEANYLFQGTSGATLSVNPDGGGVMLCRQLDGKALDADGLLVALDAFLNTLVAWRSYVAEYRARPAEAESPENAPLTGLGGDFICV